MDRSAEGRRNNENCRRTGQYQKEIVGGTAKGGRDTREEAVGTEEDSGTGSGTGEGLENVVCHNILDPRHMHY